MKFNKDFQNNSMLIINEKYTLTHGLVNLLTKEHPDGYTTKDLSEYREILLLTNAHKRKFNRNEHINSTRIWKYTNIIAKLFPSRGKYSTKNNMIQKTFKEKLCKFEGQYQKLENKQEERNTEDTTLPSIKEKNVSINCSPMERKEAFKEEIRVAMEELCRLKVQYRKKNEEDVEEFSAEEDEEFSAETGDNGQCEINYGPFYADQLVDRLRQLEESKQVGTGHNASEIMSILKELAILGVIEI